MTSGKLKKKCDIKILVVDDDLQMNEALCEQLKDCGFQAVAAANGFEALTCLEREKFSLVISDLKMPKMDGIILLKEIKAKEPDLEVIMITGHDSSDAAIQAIRAGAFDYITKPFQINEFILLVERALEKSELKALVALYEAGQVLFHKQPLKMMMDRVVQLAAKVLQADEGSVLLIDENHKLYEAASAGASVTATKHIHFAIGERIAAKSAEDRQEYLIVDGLENHPEFKTLQSNPKIYSSIVCPLIFNDELLGVLTLNRIGKSVNFTPSDLRNAGIFASQVALGVLNSRLDGELEKKITELGNAYMTLETTKDRLVQNEKMASIGRLVSGVAHELNNPLTAVIGYTQLMLQGELPSDVRTQLSVVSREADRCKKIVQDLLTFARARKPRMLSVDILQVLRETLSGFSGEMTALGVVPELQLPAGRIIVDADPNQMNQVYTNILQNALTVLGEVTGVRKLVIKAGLNGDKFEVTFQDSGPGIKEEHLAKLFDPFFTTRDVGKGTGLGLSIAYGIIQEHRGTIEVTSKENEGAVFKVTIPADKSEALTQGSPEADAKPSSHPGLHGASKKINMIVIEDEPIVLGFMKTVLEAAGHKVDTASDGLAAAESLKKNRYDLVLCDLRLPKMTGKELFLRLKKEQPALIKKFIMATGSLRVSDGDDTFFKQESIPVISKPFTAKELVDIVDSQSRKLYS